MLAKILPGFTEEKRLDAYKGVLREALEEGYVNSSNSLEVLQHMRQELDISDNANLDATLVGQYIVVVPAHLISGFHKPRNFQTAELDATFKTVQAMVNTWFATLYFIKANKDILFIT